MPHMRRILPLIFAFCVSLSIRAMSWAQGPPGGSLQDQVEQAYEQAQQYQAATAFTSASVSGRWTEVDETELHVAIDRPTGRLKVDTPDVLIVCDGTKLRAKSPMFPGVYVEVDQPSPLTYDAVAQHAPMLARMPVPDAIFLLHDTPVFVLTEGDSATASPAPADPGDAQQRQRLVTQTRGGTLAMRLGKPLLLDQAVIEVDLTSLGGEPGDKTTVSFDIDIQKHNQPIDDDQFDFDTTGLRAAPSFQQQPAGMAQGGGGNPGQHWLIGQKAPDFKLPDAAGQEHKLSDYTEDIIVLGFWASWDISSAKALPAWQKLQETADANGESLRVITINCGETAEQVAAVWNKLGLTIVALVDEPFATAAGYALNVVPHTVILKGGVIRYLHSGPNEDYVALYRPQIEVLLAETPVPSDEPEEKTEETPSSAK